jgi:hypothetical protein
VVLQRHDTGAFRVAGLYVLGSSNLARLSYRPLRALRQRNEAGWFISLEQEPVA